MRSLVVRHALALVVLCSLILPALAVPASAEEVRVPPLFPVEYPEPLADPQKAFEEVKDLILEKYYTTEVDEAALYRAAIQGMLARVSPPQTPGLAAFYTPDEYAKMLEALSGEQVSLGIRSTFNPAEGSLTVNEILPDSPSEMILKPLDRILRVNGKSLKGKTLPEINALLEGKNGDSVTLTVNRDIKVFDVILKLSPISTQDLVVTPLTDSVALVEMARFTANISQTLDDEMKKLTEAGIGRIILDLRSDGGGLLIEALKAAELLIPENHVLLRTVRRETGLQNYVSSNKAPYDFKIVILADRATASSAEVLAAALRDNGKAFIVGEKTFGKGVFETTFPLKDDHHVKFITGAMYSPKGVSWQSQGLKPDFYVEQDPRTLATLKKQDPKKRLITDTAMLTAFKLITGQCAGN